MRKADTPTSFVRHALVVIVTVIVCTAILAVVRPWRSDGAGEQMVAHSTQALSAASTNKDVEAGAPAAKFAAASAVRPVRPPLVKISTAAIRDAGFAEAPGIRSSSTVVSPSTPEDIQLAKRDRSPSSVPLPQKQAPVPVPARNEPTATIEESEAAGGESTASDKEASDPPLPTAAPPEPEVRGRLSKAAGDAALAPLLADRTSEDDVDTLKEFVKRTYAEDYPKARSLMEKLDDPIAKKFARWYYYRKKAPDTDAEEIIAFLNDNPRWPSQDELRESAEDALFWRETDRKRIIDYFAGRQPISGAGLAALGTALIAEERKDEGRKYVAEAWRKHPLTPAIEKKIRKLKVLDPADHRARADYLLMQDNKSYVDAVKRLMPLIDKKWRPSLKARIATVKRARSAGTLLTKLDKKIKQSTGVLLARIRWLRRKDRDKKVWSLLRSAPTSAAELIDPEEWWKEREVQVRLALNAGKPKTAYAIAKDHGEGLEHWDLSDAEFLAGWIALRFLDQPEAARKHFLAAIAAGGLPKRRSRAAYWLARTELALGNRRDAIARFAEGAQHYHTFYGQLAHQMINSTDAKVAFRNFVRPTESEIKRFVEQDVLKAIVLTQQANFENLMSEFLYDLARTIESAPEMILLCELAVRVAPQHRAVRMAKIAVNRDFAVEHYAYPDALPTFKVLGEGGEIDDALVQALTRQESEFNPTIVSSAGAVGLMQLLPSTAKMMAREHKLRFSKSKLSKDPAYNVSLGTAFLNRLIANYDGSYIMALAGYNAGPGRIRQWVQKFGDPRDESVDPIDWIERIPFNETRNYVYKIMESAQIYRSRLLGEDAPLRLAEDLHRGRKDKPIFLVGTAAN